MNRGLNIGLKKEGTMYDDLKCVFWLARVMDGKKELRFEEYQKYLDEWNEYTEMTRCLVRRAVM